ncbi:MAG TPA: hypothetical protein VE933_07690, partial [Chitinophagaceae bacterium]|nr:hypothetical protein [Chitinophagaceae bacterium]
ETELENVNRGDLVFEFEGLEKEDRLHVSATDTSFISRDIVEIDTVRSGKLIIPARKLRYLVDGPITLLLSKETQKIIRDEIHGRITVSYGLKREFELAPLNPPKRDSIPSKSPPKRETFRTLYKICYSENFDELPNFNFQFSNYAMVCVFAGSNNYFLHYFQQGKRTAK